jgi:hypothetical protein
MSHDDLRDSDPNLAPDHIQAARQYAANLLAMERGSANVQDFG